ncbi:MAG: F0F1 ATP synthase subunit delta [Thiotrichales bacterium]|nr:F0F1 ATP synthase subunit delta [Thiotrichales bacterium]
MQEKATIARPYAQAAFDLAQEENALDQWAALLQRLGNVISDMQMRAVINNPKLEQDRLISLITGLCGDTVFDSGNKFIRVLIDAGRLAVAPEIGKLFEAKRAAAIGLSEVTVTSAYPLSDDQRDQIKSIMADRLGTQVEVNSTVDESLIGGVIIRSGDSVVDASLRGRLDELSNDFAS